MKTTLKLAVSIFIIVGFVMIIVGSVAYKPMKITEYIAVGVLLLTFGVAGALIVGQIYDTDDNDTNKPEKPKNTNEENKEEPKDN